MSGDDTTRTNTLPGIQQAVDHVILKRLGEDVMEMKTLLIGYHSEAIQCSAELDAHVKSCDRRYEALFKTNNAQNQHIAANATIISWIITQIRGKIVDYILLVVVAACYFLYQHHFHLPAPT